MSHLSTDRLAALADEQPTADELNHLGQCAECTRELEAQRSLLAMAGSERDAMQLPLTRWDTLAPHLRKEGLIVSSAGAPRARIAPPSPQTILRFAAAVVLIASGAIMGRLSAGASPVPGLTEGGEQARTASGPTADSLPTSFGSVAEADRWRLAYSDAYQRTVAFLAANDSAKPAATPAVMKARLAAMDRVARTTVEALNEAPFDPVINDFYLNAFAQRESALRQLNTVLPQGARVNGF